MLCSEFSFSQNGGWVAETSLLCEQIFTGGRNSLFATGKSHFGHSASYEKALSLLPGTYYGSSHSTSSIIITSKV